MHASYLLVRLVLFFICNGSNVCFCPLYLHPKHFEQQTETAFGLIPSIVDSTGVRTFHSAVLTSFTANL
jgi:hypothetical protein